MGQSINKQPLPQAIKELCQSGTQDFCAVGGARTLTYADIIAFAIAQGLTYPNGVAVAATDLIGSIQILTTPANLIACDDGGTDVVANGEMVPFLNDGGKTAINAGGSSYQAGHANGDDFDDIGDFSIEIPEGSCVSVAYGVFQPQN